MGVELESAVYCAWSYLLLCVVWSHILPTRTTHKWTNSMRRWSNKLCIDRLLCNDSKKDYNLPVDCSSIHSCLWSSFHVWNGTYHRFFSVPSISLEIGHFFQYRFQFSRCLQNQKKSFRFFGWSMDRSTLPFHSVQNLVNLVPILNVPWERYTVDEWLLALISVLESLDQRPVRTVRQWS